MQWLLAIIGGTTRKKEQKSEAAAAAAAKEYIVRLSGCACVSETVQKYLECQIHNFVIRRRKLFIYMLQVKILDGIWKETKIGVIFFDM